MSTVTTEQSEKVSEDRQRKYWDLSSFYGHVKYMEEYHPDAREPEIINIYLDNKEAEAKAYQEMADYDKEVWRRNERLLRAIKAVKGKTFYKHLLEIIKSLDRIDGMMGVVKEPNGKWQDERYGRTIKGLWVDQWSTGTEGDSFSGNAYVQLKENKYLKIGYSM